MFVAPGATEKQLGDFKCRVTPCLAVEGKPVLIRLMQLLHLPAIALFNHGKPANTITVVQMIDALGSLAMNLQPADIKLFDSLFAKGTQVYNEENQEWVIFTDAIQNVFFAGRYDRWVAWLRFCCEVNFSTFLAGWLQELNEAKAATETKKAPLASPSPPA